MYIYLNKQNPYSELILLLNHNAQNGEGIIYKTAHIKYMIWEFFNNKN